MSKVDIVTSLKDRCSLIVTTIPIKVIYGIDYYLIIIYKINRFQYYLFFMFYLQFMIQLFLLWMKQLRTFVINYHINSHPETISKNTILEEKREKVEMLA